MQFTDQLRIYVFTRIAFLRLYFFDNVLTRRSYVQLQQIHTTPWRKQVRYL